MQYFFSNDGSVSARIEGRDGNKTLFYVTYRGSRDSGAGFEMHEIKPYKWATWLHGNPPPGTPLGYFRASRNGKRVIIL